jgi:hypothetical protein
LVELNALKRLVKIYGGAFKRNAQGVATSDFAHKWQQLKFGQIMRKIERKCRKSDPTGRF